MFREYLEKSKVWVDKIASAVMNYTELENKVREATSDEPWGPHGKILNDLARETHDSGGLVEIMTMLLTRIFSENPNNWRRTYKGLTVLAHLLRVGSERVCDIALDNIYNLRSLENYQCVDERGRDLGSSVRIKAHEVVELIQDPEFLKSERQKALSCQKIYDGIGNSHFSGPNNYSKNYSAYDDDDDSYRFPVRAAPKSEMPWHSRGGVDSSFQSSPPKQLGSFESWKEAHERTIVDEVADKFSEMYRAAKVVTNDLFGKPRVPPPSIYEEDPHKVSEETFSFPEELEEDQGGFSGFQKVPTASAPSNSTSMLVPARSLTQPLAPASLVDLDASTSESRIATPPRLPRPPSSENLASWSKNAQISGNIDLLAECGKSHARSAAISAPSTDLFADFNVAFPALGANSVTSGVGGAKPLGDADFSDFSSFQTAPETGESTPGIIEPTYQSAEPLFNAFSSSPTPTFSTTAMPFTPSMTMLNHQPSDAMTSPVVNQSASSKAPSNLGKTWSDLTALNINLDFEVTKNPIAQKPAAPSLIQLQNQRQNSSSVQPIQPQKNSLGNTFGTITQPNNSAGDDFSAFKVFK